MADPTEFVVAAFDFDGTLARGGSVYKWLRHVGGAGRTFRAVLRGFGAILWGVLRSGDAADHAKEALFSRILRGRDASEVAAASAAFGEAHLANRGRAVVIERLQWHRRQGHAIVVVSASPEPYVATAAAALGADGVVATRLAVDPLGHLTGGYLGRNCRGEEKRRRLAAWIAERASDRPVSLYAYGNSRGDRAMLKSADFAFDAGRLGQLGAMRQFERLSTP